MRTLVAYGSHYGTTKEAAELIADELRNQGDIVTVLDAGEHVDLGRFDMLVVGSGIYAGHFRHRVMKLLERIHKAGIEDKLHVFALGPVEDKQFPDAREQLEQIMRRAHLEDVPHELFGGAMLAERLPFWLRRIESKDARDDDAVRAWARQLHEARVPSLPN